MKEGKDKLILDDSELIEMKERYEKAERSGKPKKLVFKEDINGKT